MNELITINDKNYSPIQLYTGDGLDQVIEEIEQEALSFVPDMTTEKGRKAVASNAYKVTRSITALDDAGKNLTEDWRSKTNQVNASRRNMRGRLTLIRDNARKPLTEWEEADKERIAGHEDCIQRIIDYGIRATTNWIDRTVEDLQENIAWVEGLSSESFEEFKAKAKMAKDQAIINIKHGIAERKAYDKAEADRIQAEAEERSEREERIAKVAAKQAKKDAEEKAEKERIKAAAAEKERIAKIEADKQAVLAQVEADKQAAIQAQKDAQAKIELERKEAAEAMKAAQEKAERDKEAAIQAERDRQAAEDAAFMEKERLAEKAEAKKAANKAHQGKFNREALNSAVEAGFDPDEAKAFIEAVAKGQIKHITINY